MRSYLIGAVGLAVVAGLVLWIFTSGGQATAGLAQPAQEVPILQEGPRVTAEQDTAPAREEVSPPVVAKEETAKLPWDPSVLNIDPKWCMPTDLKQNMHWRINTTPLYQGEFIPPSYTCRVTDIALDDRVNPTKAVLTDEEAKQLDKLLADNNEVLQYLCKEEWKLKGLALHEAVERGDYLATGPMETSSPTGLSVEEMRKRVQPVANQEEILRQRYGKPFKDYFHVVFSGPPPQTQHNYVLYVPRSQATKAFEMFENVVKTKEQARAQAREFFARLGR